MPVLQLPTPELVGVASESGHVGAELIQVALGFRLSGAQLADFRLRGFYESAQLGQALPVFRSGGPQLHDQLAVLRLGGAQLLDLRLGGFHHGLQLGQLLAVLRLGGAQLLDLCLGGFHHGPQLPQPLPVLGHAGGERLELLLGPGYGFQHPGELIPQLPHHRWKLQELLAEHQAAQLRPPLRVLLQSLQQVVPGKRGGHRGKV